MIEIREHPARARMPDGSLVLDTNGNTVPLITDMRAVFYQGRHVGWCGAEPGRPLSFILSLPQKIQDSIREFVEADIGGKTLEPASAPLVDEEDDE